MYSSSLIILHVAFLPSILLIFSGILSLTNLLYVYFIYKFSLTNSCLHFIIYIFICQWILGDCFLNIFLTPSEVGVNLKDGYNGDISAKDAGKIGGNMVRKLIQQAEQQMK